MYRIEHYVSEDRSRDLFLDWLSNLRDRRIQVAIIRRIGRLEQGSFGDHRYCREGVWELRIDLGPGYRVYYGLSGQRVVLLLGGGMKRSQTKDIEERAVIHWRRWMQRGKDAKQTS